ncbi:MAG TPA: alpha/beta hydrolase [Microlunatus sp.]|nr:alpha/beta hydrolase [Microlunatus sp.]
MRRVLTAIDLADATIRTEIVNPSADTTILLIHGWGSARHVWNRLVAAAGPETRLVLVDLRGHGQSSRALNRHSIDGMADDLEQLLLRLRLAKMVVVGHSMGGNVAVELAVRRPDLVAGVCCVDPAYDDPGWADAETRVEDLRDRGVQAALATLPAAFSPTASPDLLREAADTLGSTGIDVLIEALRSTYLDERAFGHHTETHQKLLQLTAPMLSVYAAPDRAERATRFPLADHVVETIADTGHFIPLEQPTRLWRTLNAWIGSSATG